MTAPNTAQSTTQPLEFEDFYVGQVFESKPYEVTREDSMRFAAEFDPQPFHLDPEAAETSFFKGLAVSGWHTTAIAMHLRVTTIHVRGGMVGAGIDEIRWTKPVRPGDQLRLREEVLGMRTLSSRSDYGLLRMGSSMTNQAGEVVMTMKVSALAPRRAVTMA